MFPTEEQRYRNAEFDRVRWQLRTVATVDRDRKRRGKMGREWPQHQYNNDSTSVMGCRNCTYQEAPVRDCGPSGTKTTTWGIRREQYWARYWGADRAGLWICDSSAEDWNSLTGSTTIDSTDFGDVPRSTPQRCFPFRTRIEPRSPVVIVSSRDSPLSGYGGGPRAETSKPRYCWGPP